VESSLVPTAVQGFEQGAKAVSAGGQHTCAIKEDGSLWCWGGNGDGQLGIGVAGSAVAPVLVSAGPAIDVSAGTAHTCATFEGSGSVDLYCWGSQLWGRLGDGELGLQPQAGAPVRSQRVFRDGFD